MLRSTGRLAALVTAALVTPAAAGDWPAWRHDISRSAATPDELPANLQRHWTLDLPPLTPAWPDQPMMPFDAAYEPIVAGRLLFVASSRTDSVTAYDTRTGEVRWRFLADGPVRFAPIWYADKLYFVCDDGHLYCLDATTGKPRWKVRGGPSDRRILGNGRVISTWPARGAPVIADGTVYFAASIWPFMGIFIHAVDAETGRTVWINDGDGSMYVKQPHSADSFAGVAPQGPMAVAGDLLLVPGGRSVPAAYERKTGKLRHFLLNENSKKGGGHTVTVADDVFFNELGAFLTATGKYLGECSPLVVADGDTVYAQQMQDVRALDLKNAQRKGPRWRIDTNGAVAFKDATAMIKAGNRLYVGRPGQVAAITLPLPAVPSLKTEFAWEANIVGTPVSLVAADDRLFISNREGRIDCFGPGRAPELTAAPAVNHVEALDVPTRTPRTAAIPGKLGITEGYAVVWSADVTFLRDLIRQSKFHVIALDPSPARVAAARLALIAANLYGERCSVHVGDVRTASLPPYLASFMFAPDLPSEALSRLYEFLRPYGGTMFVPLAKDRQDSLRSLARELPKVELKEVDGGVILTRVGALPGAGDWTHEHANAANTRVSKDSVVKSPLGVLWFGGTSNDGILPRHGHGPQPQVVDGRILIEGIDLLRAVDAYTGRLLWETPLPGLGEFYNNLAHQPGANARGTNYISMPDGIYVAYKTSCVRLDPATGKQVAEFAFPRIGDDPTPPRWGHLNVVGDYLIGAADPLFTSAAEKQMRSVSRLLTWTQNDIFATSRYLAVLNRHDGKVLWTAEAKLGFRHNTICAGGGKLFAIDRVSKSRLSALREEGKETSPARVVAWDLASGKDLWHDDHETFGTWLSYSEPFDVLVESGRVARDSLSDEPTGMRAYRGSDGKEMWFDRKAVGPAMLHGDTILRGQGGCDLRTGKPKTRRDPISGEEEEWVWSRNYGCNTPAASEHLLTFRSGAAGFYDLCQDGGTGNFGGFRSSCTNNLIVADGILAAPDYTRTCTCSYQNQCSLAMVPMPGAEEWTFYGKSGIRKVVKRVGINFGAPGDRRGPDGTLWLEFPSVGGASPAVPVLVTGSHVEYFRRHQSSATGELPWVAASGVKGVEGIAIALLPEEMADRYYTLRLHFAEPEDVKPGERVFDINVQGRRVFDGLDIVKEAGRPRTAVVKEFRGVRVNDELRISFQSSAKRPAVLCGIEVVEE